MLKKLYLTSYLLYKVVHFFKIDIFKIKSNA